MSSPSPSRSNHLRALAAILLVSALVAIAGNDSKLPLDAHDVLVARPAETMRRDGQYLVPYLDGRPRLKKPPLQYWLVAAGDALRGGDRLISPAEARWPSAAAGVALAVERV